MTGLTEAEARDVDIIRSRFSDHVVARHGRPQIHQLLDIIVQLLRDTPLRREQWRQLSDIRRRHSDPAGGNYRFFRRLLDIIDRLLEQASGARHSA